MWLMLGMPHYFLVVKFSQFFIKDTRTHTQFPPSSFTIISHNPLFTHLWASSSEPPSPPPFPFTLFHQLAAVRGLAGIRAIFNLAHSIFSFLIFVGLVSCGGLLTNFLSPLLFVAVVGIRRNCTVAATVSMLLAGELPSVLAVLFHLPFNLVVVMYSFSLLWFVSTVLILLHVLSSPAFCWWWCTALSLLLLWGSTTTDFVACWYCYGCFLL